MNDRNCQRFKQISISFRHDWEVLDKAKHLRVNGRKLLSNYAPCYKSEDIDEKSLKET